MNNKIFKNGEILIFMKILLITKEIFYLLTGLLFSFILLEIFWTGLILSFFNINLLLIFWLILVMFILYFKKY
ncbi:hypothetical protein A2531_07305 [Candidatus Falkowbacteria bacterium RIFOXYD2_FULL_34_120]|uniref:Uncharacterized protein n=1 Tax=Candidatus Falkowbacteria bacterium RIFOXYD2_FULL_34_120 TaxID=1798007 RepID=A0A1F5TM22_9BACT|nr:MAG: hypothetical protein A2500_06735 [Candidatus Falkowbacteria bacterium RIFOXYC12_FULL_34_55]OGF40005.1 MAG: hypothetical protein A2531_07305 [Candidatus Falkowbacteria bacterium RIFOXYD2_FULL_34_120]